MRLTLLFAVVICALTIGCNSVPKAPSGEEIRAALEGAFRKEDPNATVKLTDLGMNDKHSVVTVKFACTNCVVDGDGGGKKKLTSGKGSTVISTTYPERQWYFSPVMVSDEDGKNYMFSGMSGFKF